MKKLGIIGGAGPLASSLFYETLVQESYRLQCTLPEILLLNYPFCRGSTRLREELSHCLNVLEAAGAEVGVLVCNTLHLELINIPGHMHFFSIPDLVIDEIRKRKGRRLLLLATQKTCRSRLYQQIDLTMLCPSEEEQAIVEAVINRVIDGKITKEDAQLIENVINKYSNQIDGVILGCTDLPVLHHHFPIQTNKQVYDSVKIPAKTILRYL